VYSSELKNAWSFISIPPYADSYINASTSEQGAEENDPDVRDEKWQEAGEDCIMRSFITCTLHQIFLG
jgi:hypothetical protein